MAQIWHTITQKGLNAARWCGAMEGHRRAFEFFGGVPRRISYDKSKIAVSKIIGRRQRRLTREFLRLKSHSLFGSRFWLVRRPDEKG